MKMKEIRELTVESLAAKANDCAAELFNLKFQHAIRPLENTAKLRMLKKDVARIKTVQKEKEAATK